jgi:three-Cys-motif partner protein
MPESPYEDREQTAVKHRILERYLSAFVPIVGNWALDIAYVDCLAGPWQSVDPNLKDTSFARALDVLRSTQAVLAGRGKSPTMRCLFVEKESQAFASLKRYCDGVTNIEVNPRNWDLTTHISDVVKFVKQRNNSFPFIFIDPKGWEPLEIDLISPILALEPGEVLITFMMSWITRFLTDESKGFDRIFRSDLTRLMQLHGEELEEEAVKSYANSVRKAGHFQYVCTLPVMKPDQDAFHFHMIYGTRHLRGVEVFKETEKNIIPFMHVTRAQAQHRRRFEQSGQLSMLKPEAHYKEKKFTQFQLRSLEVAKSELQRMLQASKEVLYDDAWATVMQHPGVMEDDLRQWINDWKGAELLQITNERPTQKWPKKGQRQYLKWRSAPKKT